MTLSDIVEMREACVNGVAEICAYEHAILMACAKIENGGGGLLERHAMLEAFWKAQQHFWTVEGSMRECNTWECLNDSLCETHQRPYLEAAGERNAALAAIRASEALPPGKGSCRCGRGCLPQPVGDGDE